MKILRVLLILSSINLFSQEKLIKNPPEYIRTVKFYGNGDGSNIPAIRLGDRLNLEFDDISMGDENFYYTIEHYTPNWEKSDLIFLDYIKGYEEDQILNFTNSFNTDIEYINYKLSIPNENMRIKLSGNYLLKVYNSKENIIFSRPFIVYEDIVSISGQVKRPNDMQKRNTHQQLVFDIFHKRLKIDDYDRVEVVLLQNGNFKNIKKDIKPKFINKNKMTFNENNNILFSGNNEFRNIDIKDDLSTYKDINYIKRENDMLNYYIITQFRKEGEYTMRPDINGQFRVRSLRAENQSNEVNYAWVHFSCYIEEDSELEKKDEIYVYGGFNYWGLNEETKMEYNEEEKIYETEVLLKQGFYDYNFVKKDKKGNVDYSFFDGSKYETENVYQIIVYYKNLYDRYYKCVGFTNISSESIRN